MRVRISYFFQLHPNSYFCERRRKIALPIKLFWKKVFEKIKKTAYNSFPTFLVDRI
jgi:hypothetical protein